MARPLEWMAAVRDHANRPTGTQRHVLFALALRMDWQTGCGFASSAQLASDAEASERTVRYATSWARGQELLVQTRRGHYISAERKVSSEWRLAMPQTQPAPGCTLGEKPTGKDSQPNRQTATTQPATGAPPSRPRSSRPRSSANGRGAHGAAPSLAQSRPFRAPPCPECGKPFSQEFLADPERRGLAFEGSALCSDECDRADAERYYANQSIAELLEGGSYDLAVKRGPAAVAAILGISEAEL
jgi:hypothetical protein